MMCHIKVAYTVVYDSQLSACSQRVPDVTGATLVRLAGDDDMADADATGRAEASHLGRRSGLCNHNGVHTHTIIAGWVHAVCFLFCGNAK